MRRFNVAMKQWRNAFIVWVIFFPSLVLVGQTTTDVTAIAQSVGVALEIRSGPPSTEVKQQIGALLKEPLNEETAVRVALLNSSRIQSLLQELRIARAELIAGRSFPNPEVEASRRWGDEAHTEIAILFDMYRIIFHPLKKSMANAISRATRFRVADAIIEEVTRVRIAFVTLQGLLHTRTMLNSELETTSIGAEMATRLKKAGNISQLEQSMQEALRQEAQLVMVRNDAEIRGAHERLAGILGVQAASLTIQPELPEIPSADPALDELEQQALLQRSDLAAAREEKHAAEQAFKLARLEVLPSFSAGILTEKDHDGRRLTGPTISVEIPIFDFGYPARARARAHRDQARHSADALATHIISDIRVVYDQLSAARAVEAHLRESVIPLHTQILEDTLKHYNYMLAGVFQLLESKRAERKAQRELIEARRDYWFARIELERVSGKLLYGGSHP